MKKLAILILLSIPLMADTGVVVTSTGVVVGKEIFTSDTLNLNNILSVRKLNDPSLSFTLFDLTVPSSANSFNATTIPPPPQVLALVKSQANALIVTGTDANSELQRAILLTILDQLNTIRAALPTPLNPITPAQVRNAVQAKIGSGSAD